MSGNIKLKNEVYACNFNVLWNSGYLYFFDYKQHNLPYIHAKYQSDTAIISIADGTLIEGSIPPNKLKLVQAWIEIHQEELMADWSLAENGEQVFKIDPLK